MTPMGARRVYRRIIWLQIGVNHQIWLGAANSIYAPSLLSFSSIPYLATILFSPHSNLIV